MSKGKSKALDLVANIFVGVCVVFLFIVSLNILLTSNKGYSNIFGTAIMAVKTDSMIGEKDDSFNPGDLIFVKILDDEAKKSLKIDDVVTFYANINGKVELNSHRIIDINDVNGEVTYQTKGDNVSIPDIGIVKSSSIIGVYSSKIASIGKAILFVQSPTGFLVCVVFPSLLLVVYFGFLVAKHLAERNKEKLLATKDELYAEFKKQIEEENKNNKN